MKVKWLGCAAALLALLLFAAWSSVAARRDAVSAQTYTSYASGDFFFPPYPSDSDRMGVSGSIGLYDPILRAGWYTDWGASANPSHPGGMEYARTIYFQINTNGCGLGKIPATQRSQVAESITGTALIENLRANPGALWLVGNEPDSIYNCSPIMPELYAELYHEFYTFIKAYDPSARVAIGAIVQPSPLRLEYLNKVLNRYQALYGEKLPTALWNIHLYAFAEVAYGAGAGVPPGASSNVGWTYGWKQTIDIGVLAQNLRAMRQWMADHGERDKPLIVTEFGQVVPDNGSYTLDGLTFTLEVSRDYLQGSITHFLTATDALIGYPADGNRLIQLWAWYSLYDSYYGGDLVNLDRTLTPAGTAFAQIASQRWAPYADLYPAPLATLSLPTGGTVAISTSLGMLLYNRGNTPAQSVPVRFAQYDYASGQLVASSMVTVSETPARYEGAPPQVSAEWVWSPEKVYTLTFEIDPGQTISQARRSNQQLIYLVGQPDLALVSLASGLPNVFYWERPITTTITATIRNLGDSTSLTGTVQFSMSGTQGTAYWNQMVEVPPLAPNAAVNVTGTLEIPSPGDYVITATAECVGLDADAWNNQDTLHLLATAPDLALTSLTGEATVVYYLGYPITLPFTATISNVGGWTSLPGQVQFSVSTPRGIAPLRRDVSVPALAPNLSVDVTNTLTISLPGAYVVTATAQYTGASLNLQNDVYTLTILSASTRVYMPLGYWAPSEYVVYPLTTRVTPPSPGARDCPVAPIGVIFDPPQLPSTSRP